MQRIVKAGLYMKSKQLPLIEKCICLTIFFVNLFYKFSAMHLSLALVGFQNEPEFIVNEVCFEEENDIPNTREKSRKNQSVTEWCRCGKWG